MAGTEDAIDAAITAHVHAGDAPGVVVGWVAIAAIVDYHGEESRSGIELIYPGGSMPWPQALGIIEAARVRMHDCYRRGEA